MKLFIAIEVSGEMKKELNNISKALRERSCGGRFVPPENFHITLRYIGESDDLAGAASAMREACRDIRPFRLSLGSYGFFEKTGSGSRRVSLVTVEGELSELSVLYESLDSALSDQGFPRELKRFVPHVTLGRSVEHDDLVTEELKSIPLSSSVTVTGITLFESSLIKGRQVYSPLHREKF
ncbi:MAG: RNA 2',3'-cyclic phosphodiesterase [Clostridiales bacterium]|nr:RNA 2',3'-cyclic phosphodiesterase [Clostridiales bacterium]